MTRAEKVAEAQRLRAEGLKLREIGERMGAKPKTVHTWLADPDLSKQRARREVYAGTCLDCGEPTDGSAGPSKAAMRCARCAQHQHDERNERIFAAWGRGDTAKMIGAREGMTEGAVGSLIDHHRQRKGRSLVLHRRRSRELWPLIERRWHEGVTLRGIGAECGTGWHDIGEMVKKMRKAGIDLPYRAARGPAGHSEHIRRRAVQLYAEGQSSEAVGDVLGVAGSTVRRWVHQSGACCRPTGRRRKAAA